MTRTVSETSNSGSRSTRGAKGRGKASAGSETGNAIEGSSIRRIDLPPQPGPSATPVQVDPTPAEVKSELRSEAKTDERRIAIALAAYYRAEQRGFAPGFEVEDWLEAEREILEKEGAIDLR
jgi:hypothetical protein